MYDFADFDISEITNIHKKINEKTWYKIMLGII